MTWVNKMTRFYNKIEMAMALGIFVLGLNLGSLVTDYVGTHRGRTISHTDSVQQGYAVPREMRIKLHDLNMDGQKEVLFVYEGRNYLLTLDERRQPRIQPYEIRPTENRIESGGRE